MGIPSSMHDLDESFVRKFMGSLPQMVQFVCCRSSSKVEPKNRDSPLEIFRAGAVSSPTKELSIFTTYFSTSFNTSCRPNVRICNSKADLLVKAARQILPGEELCYAVHYSFACMTTAERQEAMTTTAILPRRCTCNVCTQPAAERLVSDWRRELMRTLWFLLKGHDLPNVKPKIANLKETNPEAPSGIFIGTSLTDSLKLRMCCG
jgi:hypothetical protein